MSECEACRNEAGCLNLRSLCHYPGAAEPAQSGSTSQNAWSEYKPGWAKEARPSAIKKYRTACSLNPEAVQAYPFFMGEHKCHEKRCFCHICGFSSALFAIFMVKNVTQFLHQQIWRELTVQSESSSRAFSNISVESSYTTYNTAYRTCF